MKRAAILLIHLLQVVQAGVDWMVISTFGYKSYCKHSPTCSEYAIHQIQQHGTISGLYRGIKRILSCR